MICDVPSYLAVLVRGEFLRDFRGGHGEFARAYLVAVTAIRSRPLLFTVHTEHGACFSRLPIHALCSKPCEMKYGLSDLMPWGVVGDRIHVIQHKYFKDFDVRVRLGQGEAGRYLFTVDQYEGGFSEIPEQTKTMNFIELDCGQFAAMPNNYCLFPDTFFAGKAEGKPDYVRNSKYWVTG